MVIEYHSFTPPLWICTGRCQSIGVLEYRIRERKMGPIERVYKGCALMRSGDKKHGENQDAVEAT